MSLIDQDEIGVADDAGLPAHRLDAGEQNAGVRIPPVDPAL